MACKFYGRPGHSRPNPRCHDTDEDDNVPIHRRGRHGHGDGEEAEDPDGEQPGQSAHVDEGGRRGPMSQRREGRARPRRRWSTRHENRDDVGSQDGDESQRADGVECHGGSDVDQREQGGDEEGEDHGVERDVPAWFDLQNRMTCQRCVRCLRGVEERVDTYMRRCTWRMEVRCHGRTTTFDERRSRRY